MCGREPGLPSISHGESLNIDITLQVYRPLQQAVIVVNILNQQAEVLTTLISTDSGTCFSLDPGIHTVRCDVGPLPLVPGDYRLSVGTAQSSNALAWDVMEALPGFRVDGGGNTAWLQSPDRAGVLLLERCKWEGVLTG